MSKQAVRNRRRFADVADEIEHVYQKLVFWHCRKSGDVRARQYAARLKKLLLRDETIPGSIFGEECWSLIFEVEGDVRHAIRHRENEIRLIRRLHEITPGEQFDLVSSWYGHSDLSDRLVILADLYHQIGQTDRAIRILRESKALCRRHGIPFDGEDILEELLNDTTRNGQRTHPAARRTIGRKNK